MLLVLAAHVFYMYCLARANAETFGFDVGTTIVASLFALAMLVPLVWAVTLPELPEIYTTHIRARRWWKQDRCHSCGYPRAGLDEPICPECGCGLAPPRDYALNARTVALFIAMNLAAWVVGCAVAESLYSADEAAFVREAAQHASQGFSGYQRYSHWPGKGILVWDEDGYQRARGGVMSVSAGRSTPSPPKQN